MFKKLDLKYAFYFNQGINFIIADQVQSLFLIIY